MAELVESMRAVGQIEPITVERHDGMCEIITGHRRVMAARELNWPDIAAIVYDEPVSDRFAMMLHENIVREDLNPAEEALFMAQAREKLELDEAGLCKLFKRGPDYIAGRFALLRGDPEIFKSLAAGEIRLGVAHELNRVGDDGMRHYYLDAARRSDPPARVVHQWVSDWLSHQQPALAMVGAGAPQPTSAAPAPDGSEPAGSDVPAGSPSAVQTVVPGFGCQLCGGNRDPYNLVTVMMHKWEWQQILDSVARAARGEQ